MFFVATNTMRWIGIAILVMLAPMVGYPQDDPDPNSPIPVLLSEKDSTRALASPAGKGRAAPSQSSRIFWPNEKVGLFVTNLALLEGEGSNAFRIYMKDSKGREYRFPVLEIRPSELTPGVFSIVTQLTDESRYWPAPNADGDVLVRLTWRGLTSNSVRLAFGATGGPLKEDPGAVPTPLSAAVGKGGSGNSQGPTNELVGYRWSGDRARFLQQATFGSTQALDSRLRRIGLKTWLAEQFEAQYPSLSNPYPNIPLMAGTPPSICNGSENPTSTPPDPPDDPPTCFRDRYSMYPVQTWFFREALYGEPQLRHRVAWSLAQIWVIAFPDIQQSSHMIQYHKLLSKNAFGNYRDLMRDMTLNPGMGNYLDMMRSTRNNPNENYPREILQLFSIGLYMMNQDGTLQTDGMGAPIPTYDQETVNNFTKVFTGWRDCRVLSAACPNTVLGAPNFIDPMELAPANHDITAKTLLNYPGAAPNIAACAGCNNAAITTYANNSLEQALDNIFYHPNVAPFVSRILIQHLVTSDPTPAYVGRISAVFNNNGLGTRGDMKAVVRAILLDPEARGDIKTDPNYGKLREPVQLITNVLKAFDVKNAALTGPSDGVIQNLSAALLQNVFLSPTVFNYYSPDYVIPGTSLNGPEFGVMTTGTAVGRANFANTMVYGQINPVVPNIPVGTRLDLAEMQALAAADATGNLLVDALNWRLMHGRMSADMKSRILTAVLAEPAANTLNRARAAIYLVATSSQFQIQR